MDELPPALTPEREQDLLHRDAKGRTQHMNQLRYASTACFHSKELKSWMRGYAEWLALQSGRPALTERQAIANKLARDKVSPKAIRHLEQRVDFRDYYDRLAAGAVTAARAKLEAESPWYVEKHREGLEAALKEGDYKAIPNFTGPVLERVWPRREAPIVATQITINLSARQQTDLTQPPPELLEAEVIEEPPSPT
jgi:hypothetical protein